ncbi:SIR2 family protein [Methylobacterium sp. J-030]|uniref:SIR2 family protein n=1 Tax=Methylobacterium sp. J-030 TaxID=2836627 RepID=UPI001FBB7EF9|nr:SIR2 family protein [Methylobacterium sp. J-030]MCJ2070580.1 SIR2 family protein [Methylobacterium sp. J-030]
MRFLANGPDIPDELLVARDAGNVIFFCGAGVSQHEADLPNFVELAESVIEILGSAQDSRARSLLSRMKHIGPMPGVGGLIAADRVFGLLEREFEVADVRSAVAEAIEPKSNAGLGAHRVLLDLATARGITRLVTTNFDLLFENCDPSLSKSGPPNLPDPGSDREFRGIVHLHGRVDATYRRAQDEEFVISSADFGRAYLSLGWATHFIQKLLAKYQIVFVGYSADDPPVQYLLEGLNLKAGTPNRLYAFQNGEQASAVALWEHRGVRAIPFDASSGFSPLWDSLAAWSRRARDINGWHREVLARAGRGPQHLLPHERGQVAHILSTRAGARRLSASSDLLDAKWILVCDPAQRYHEPENTSSTDGTSAIFDPYDHLHLDNDPLPDPGDPENIRDNRKVPANIFNGFRANALDQSSSRTSFLLALYGSEEEFQAQLPSRLRDLGWWLANISHQPTALWWATRQPALHPQLLRALEAVLKHEPTRFPSAIRRGWRMLIKAWADVRPNPDLKVYEVSREAALSGWSASLIRDLAEVYRPKIIVRTGFALSHPLLWSPDDALTDLISLDVEYPNPHQEVDVPDTFVALAIAEFRAHLELAIDLEFETRGYSSIHLGSTGGLEGETDSYNNYGIVSLIVRFQKLFKRFAAINPNRAAEQVRSWPADDEHVFARLRIWASGSGYLTPTENGSLLAGLSERIFWGTAHQSDILRSLAARWSTIDDEDRTRIEQRLLNGSYPWEVDAVERIEELVAHERLNRLYWLSNAGVSFSFDLGQAMETLRAVAVRWEPRDGETAADTKSGGFLDVVSDHGHDPLLAIPVSEILRHSQNIEGLDLRNLIDRAPFSGLVSRKPVRALAALSHAARSGEAPKEAWSVFLRADRRPNDPLRMIRTIAVRLQRLPAASLSDLAYPVSAWMNRIGARLYDDATEIFPELWAAMIVALRAVKDEDAVPRRRKWADRAMNAPVGGLFDLLVKDPSVTGRKINDELPSLWLSRLDDLLSLTGDQRRYVLALLGQQINWLFQVAPAWVKGRLIEALLDAGADGEAIWEGMSFPGGVRSKELATFIKASLLSRSILPQDLRPRTSFLAQMLLGGWGADEKGDRLLSSEDLREVLIQTDDKLRVALLWQLERWISDKAGPWRARTLLFFTKVWPKQRALHTSHLSGHLANFVLASGDLMPNLLEVILPRLVPIRDTPLRFEGTFGSEGEHSAVTYPAATLDLLWAVLGEDVSTWPHQVEQAFELLAQAPETASDARLAELRRRWDLV